MNNKVSKKPTLILMAGLPGVGKTTLARELGRRLGWIVLEKDMLKELFLADPLLKENFDERTAGWEAYEYALNFTENILVNQRLSVILDTSLLYSFILERAEQLAKRSGAQLKIILCEVDESTRQHRLRTREAKISQAKAHLVPKEAAKQFEQLDPSLYKRVETNRSINSYIEEALTYVTRPEVERRGVVAPPHKAMSFSSSYPCTTTRINLSPSEQSHLNEREGSKILVLCL